MTYERKWFTGLIIAISGVITLLTAGIFAHMAAGKTIQGTAAVTVLVFLMWAALHLYYLTEYKKKKGRELHPGRFFFLYCVCIVFTAGMYFVPPYMRPLLIIGLLFGLLTDSNMAAYVQLYFITFLAFLEGTAAEFYLCMLISGTVAAFAAPYLYNKKMLVYISLLLLSIHTLTINTAVFYAYGRISLVQCLYGIGAGIISLAFVFIILPFFYNYIKYNNLNKLKQITKEDYSLLIKLKEHSEKEYSHAVRTAYLCERVAQKLEADVLLAKAGGLYHKIGRIKGKPYVKNGIALAQKYKFPREVARLIAEHNGSLAMPSTLESAIVMLSDAIITNVEYLSSKLENLEYEPKTVISHIIDTKFETGLLNETGINIELFLKLRHYMIEEAIKIDIAN